MDSRYPLTCSTGEVANNYEDYLKTNHWKTMRVNLAQIENNKCQKCGKIVKKGFHAHHKTYANLGNENLSDLMFLCEDCHVFAHCLKKPKKNKSEKKKLEKKKPEKKNREVKYNSRLERVETVSSTMYRNIYQSVMKLDKHHMTLLRDSLNEKLK